MSWSTSDRKSRLPADWPAIRRRVLRRDGRMCQFRLPDHTLCLALATEVDHIVPGDNHAERNLQALCHPHHQRKSAQEGAAASAAKKKAMSSRFRRTESHPGAL